MDKVRIILALSLFSVLIGCSAEVEEVTVNQAPIAGFTYVVDGMKVTFTDTSTDEDGNTLTYDWDLENYQEHSSDKNPVWTYGDKGHKTVYLWVTDEDGKKDSYAAEFDIN